MLLNPLMDARQLLEWHIEAGVDEACDDAPVNYFTAVPPPALREAAPVAAPIAASVADAVASVLADMPPQTAPAQPRPLTPALHHTPSAAMASARALADNASTLAELEEAVRGFDGCAIKKTASKTVFADGNPKARVMIIGEAPGAQEDLQGIPFCGPSGALLDKMLAAIGLDRRSVYISNSVFWRPPGNRQPSAEETMICQPFVEKHIALVKPALLILAGGTATTAVLRKEASISRLRGKLYPYTNPYITEPVQTLVTFHPSYLLRTPGQKRLAWHDLLQAQEFLSKNPANN